MINSLDFVHTIPCKISWCKAIDESKFTVAAFLGISKALD